MYPSTSCRHYGPRDAAQVQMIERDGLGRVVDIGKGAGDSKKGGTCVNRNEKGARHHIWKSGYLKILKNPWVASGTRMRDQARSC